MNSLNYVMLVHLVSIEKKVNAEELLRLFKALKIHKNTLMIASQTVFSVT